MLIETGSTVAARAGLLLSDPEMFQLALENGRGPGLAQALRAAADEFSDNDKLELLQVSILRAPPGNAALAIALLTPAMLDHPDAAELMFRTLENRELGSSAALVLSKSKDPGIQKRLAITASAKGSLASQRAALAIGQLQASEGEQP